MKKRNEWKISIILPIYNGESTIVKTLESLLKQAKQFDQLIIINDASTDNSEMLVANFLRGQIDYQLIVHKERKGLAANYNEGIKLSLGDLIVTLHQDVILMDDSLAKLVFSFQNPDIVAVGHTVIHPKEIWDRYNFWQKCFFSRLVEKEFSGIDGKFDCFRRSSLEEVGLFNEINFRSAGEDGDMVFKLQRIGKIVNSQAEIIHLHKIAENFSYQDIIYKQKQYSEAQGALLSLGRMRGTVNISKAFFRELLIISLLFPYIRILSILAILAYSILYTGKVFSSEYRDKRILGLPFLNVYLLFISFIYSLSGIIYKKQRI